MPRIFAACLLLVVCCRTVQGEPWSQFRGPNASGLAASGQPLPTHFGPEQAVVWKTALPPGHSSPVVYGQRVYLTALRGESLLTIALDKQTGRVLWEREAPHQGLEEVHQVGSPAQSTCATDGQRVISLFGSCGLFCYDPQGKLLWNLPMGPFKNNFGAGSSPIIVGPWVVLSQDHDTDSFVMALDKRDGRTVWKTDRSEFPRNYATPVIWEVNGQKQIVVVGTLRIVGYDFQTGEELWTVRGVSRIVNMTPVVGGDGNLYVAAYAPGGDPTNRIVVPVFAELISKHDANGNGTIEPEEAPEGTVSQRFGQIDRDKNGRIDETEYNSMRAVFEAARNVVMAIRPGGRGDVTDSHVLWRQQKQIPYVSSPLYHDGYLFLVKDGGIVSCLDAKTGQPTKLGRVSGTRNYFASPVAGDGKIFLVSQRGELTVISAQPQWEELAVAEFGEEVFSTPAIVDGRIYLRTAGHLYCFGLPE